MERKEIVEAISGGRIGAVSLDTTVFDSKQRNFRQVDLRAVSQFGRRGTPVVITDVVEQEMISHLEAEAAETQRALRTALRLHNLRWHRRQPEGEGASLLVDESAAEYARREFAAFAAEVGATTLPVAEPPDAMAELFRRYFAIEPPFAGKASRRTEFADAAALIRLETYAREKGTMVLCVAQDRAWTEFAAASEHLVTVFPLNIALGLFNEAYQDQDLADEIVRLWVAGEQDEFEEQVRDAIVDRLGDVDYEVQAETGIDFDAEPLEAELLEICQDALGDPIVLAADQETVTFSIDIDIKARFGASFGFSVWDGVDREFVPMGSEWAETTDDVTLPLTIVAERESSDGIRAREISVGRRQFSVDFGYVDAFPAEDPDE